MLGLANSNMDVGFAGWVPAMIARTSGIPISGDHAERGREHEPADELAEHRRQGLELDPDAGRSGRQDDRGQRAQGRGRGDDQGRAREERLDPNSIKLLALPFPAMRAALQSGQVDAIWTPEPFLSQAIQIDGGPRPDGPWACARDYWPIGGYFVAHGLGRQEPGPGRKFRTAMNQSLEYAQNHPDEVRDLLPRLAEHPPADLDDRRQPRAAGSARGVHEEVRRDHVAAEPRCPRPERDRRRQNPAGDGRQPVHHAAPGRQAGTRLRTGKYSIIVTDASPRRASGSSAQVWPSSPRSRGRARRPGRST